MKAYSHAGGLGVNWCLFGSNGHMTRPTGGVLESYTMRAADDFFNNRIIKTVCDPVKVLGTISVHFPVYRKGFDNLSDDGTGIDGTFSDAVHFSEIRINHYFTKSFEEFKAKRARGMADHLSGIRSIQDFDYHDQNVIPDTEILSRC